MFETNESYKIVAIFEFVTDTSDSTVLSDTDSLCLQHHKDKKDCYKINGIDNPSYKI